MSTHRNRPNVTVLPGFLLLAALLFYLDDGMCVLPWVALSAAIHESGHILASYLFGGKVTEIRFGLDGAELTFLYSDCLNYWQECIVVLAGPLSNLLASGMLFWAGRTMPGIMSLGLGLFNLLPVFPLDGGRVLYNLAAANFEMDMTERIALISGGLCTGIFVGLGLIAVAEYANFTMLISASWMAAILISGVNKKNAKK